MIIVDTKYFAKAASLTLTSILTTSITYGFLYFALIFLATNSEVAADSANMLFQYKNFVAIFYGLIVFLSIKFPLGKKEHNPFTNIQLGILVYVPAVLTTAFLIPYSLS